MINLIEFGGFTEKSEETITQPQVFFFGNITFDSMEVAKHERLIYFSLFEAKANHVFQFSYLQFTNINFKAEGFFISFDHSASVHTPLLMDHLIFHGNRKGIM